MSSGNFQFQKNSINKTIEFYLSGRGEESSFQNFINEYNRTVSSITPSEYDFVLNAVDMQIEQQGKIDKLVDCFVMYKNSEFKNIILKVKKDNSLLKMQLTRVARMGGVELKIQEV